MDGGGGVDDFRTVGLRRPAQKLCPVAGKVTFQGKPVTAGMIRFSNTQAPVDMLARLGPDGYYEVIRGHGPGLPEGTYQVAIVPPRPDRPLGPMAPSKPVEFPNIPEKYRQPSTSGLTLTVKPGRNNFDVDMQTP